MSTPAIIRWDQAYNRNGEPNLPRAVVNAIRTHVDNHTLTGWVKAKTLADYTGLKERAVRTQISANVKAGWLEIVQSGNSSGLANTYRLTYPKGVVENTLHLPNHVVHDTVLPEKHVVDDTLRVSSSAGNHVVHDTPTSPRTSPRNFSKSSEERTSPKEKGVVNDTIPSDPFGSGDINFPANPTSESNHVVHDTLPDGVADDTVPSWWEAPPFGSAAAPSAKSSLGAWDPFAD